MIIIKNMEREFLNGLVLVKVGDITEEDVDAIVNAANSSLMGEEVSMEQYIEKVVLRYLKNVKK